jgi:hypothetical protein
MRIPRIVSALAFGAAVIAAVLTFTVSRQAGSVAFACGGIALAAGFTALVDGLGRWGMPGDGL